MVDRVLHVEDGVRAAAVRNVPATLSIFDSHFPRLPVLPGVLLLQSMVAVARLAVRGGRLRSVHGLRLRRFVRPGDQVIITATVTRAGNLPGKSPFGNRFSGRLPGKFRDLARPDVAPSELKVEACVGDDTVATVRRLVLEAVAA